MWQQITKEKVLAVGLPLLLGQLVGATQGEDTLVWFKTLKKPAWCPPIPVFPVVWSILYALMGYASYLVWQYGGFEAQRGPLLLYGVQLALNLSWTIVFFKAKKLKTALVQNLVLLAAASATALNFYHIDIRAGRLFIPYIAWLVLANALNIFITKNNPSGDEDPKLQDLYHQDDKRNPGEQGYRPSTAALQAPGVGPSSHRSRGRLIVHAKMPARPVRRAQTHAQAQAAPARAAQGAVGRLRFASL